MTTNRPDAPAEPETVREILAWCRYDHDELGPLAVDQALERLRVLIPSIIPRFVIGLDPAGNPQLTLNPRGLLILVTSLQNLLAAEAGQ